LRSRIEANISIEAESGVSEDVASAGSPSTRDGVESESELEEDRVDPAPRPRAARNLSSSSLDHNGDGVIGLPDFNVLRSYFGGAPGPAGALP